MRIPIISALALTVPCAQLCAQRVDGVQRAEQEIDSLYADNPHDFEIMQAWFELAGPAQFASSAQRHILRSCADASANEPREWLTSLYECEPRLRDDILQALAGAANPFYLQWIAERLRDPTDRERRNWFLGIYTHERSWIQTEEAQCLLLDVHAELPVDDKTRVYFCLAPSAEFADVLIDDMLSGDKELSSSATVRFSEFCAPGSGFDAMFAFEERVLEASVNPKTRSQVLATLAQHVPNFSRIITRHAGLKQPCLDALCDQLCCAPATDADRERIAWAAFEIDGPELLRTWSADISPSTREQFERWTAWRPPPDTDRENVSAVATLQRRTEAIAVERSVKLSAPLRHGPTRDIPLRTNPSRSYALLA